MCEMVIQEQIQITLSHMFISTVHESEILRERITHFGMEEVIYKIHVEWFLNLKFICRYFYYYCIILINTNVQEFFILFE